VVTQHTTAFCSIQVVDITLMKYHFTNITSLRVVQQKPSGLYSSTYDYKPKLYKELQFLLSPKRNTRRFELKTTSLDYDRKHKSIHDDLLKTLYSIVISAT
jgi:hypothetical protein